MQFDARMIRPSQTSTSKAAGFKPKVSSILLYHHVRGDLARAKKTVLALVNWKVLCDASSEIRVVIHPTRRELFELDSVGSVAIYLISAHVNEDRLGCVPPSCLQQIKRSASVNVEIIEWSAGSQVMAGLGRGMNYQVRLYRRHKVRYSSTVTYVQLGMTERRVSVCQALLIPSGISRWSEEVCTLVVVDSGYLPALSRKVRHDLGTN